MYKRQASNKKLNKILAEEPQIAEPENPVELSKLPGDLEFHHVDFSLHDTPILQDIDFTLKQGHTLGIMGMTGSGKTTIVNPVSYTHLDVYKRQMLRSSSGRASGSC